MLNLPVQVGFSHGFSAFTKLPWNRPGPESLCRDRIFDHDNENLKKNTPLKSWDRERRNYGNKKRWCVHPWWTNFEIYFSCVIWVWRYMSLIWNVEIFYKNVSSEHVFYVSWQHSNTQNGMHASLQSCIQCTPKSLWYPLRTAPLTRVGVRPCVLWLARTWMKPVKPQTAHHDTMQLCSQIS